MATGSRTLKLSILGDVDSLSKSLKQANNDVDNSSSKIGDFSKKAGLAFAALAAAAGAMAIKVGIDAVKAASNLSETVSKVGVLFGNSAIEVEKFAATAATKLGQTKQQALDAAATFATFGKAAGLSGDDLVKFSTGFTSLASDLASFNNTSPEQAINAIGSALRGEAEPLRAYGVLLDDASLRQAALELGIISTTKNALTPQQKVLAAQELIYKQTGAAQGDFERTSTGLANQTRILSAQFENAKTTLGTALLPIVLEVTTFFSKNFMPIIERVAGAFSNEDGGLGDSISDVVNTLKSYFLPIWEGLQGAFKTVSDAITDNIDKFKSFWEVVKYIAPLVGGVLGKTFQVIGEVAGSLIDVFSFVLGAIKPMVNFIIDMLNKVITGINLIKTGADIAYIPKIGSNPTYATSGAPGAISGGGIPKVIIPTVVTDNITIPGGTTTTTSSSTSSAATIAAAAKKAKADQAALDKMVAGAFDMGASGTTTLAGIEAMSNRPFAFGTSGVDTSTLAGILKASATTVNVTVNGAIDAEGTSRTIVDTLNNSFFRGTGGASNLQIA